MDAEIHCGDVTLYSGYFADNSGWSYTSPSCPFIYWTATNKNWIHHATVQITVSSSDSNDCLNPTGSESPTESGSGAAGLRGAVSVAAE